MFELIEAVRGRLIGPKSWNRVVCKFLKPKWIGRGSGGLFGAAMVFFMQ